MENNFFRQFDESFDSVIQELTLFVGYASKLPKNPDKILELGINYRYCSIEDRIQKYLSYPKNIQRLEHYVDILRKVSDKIIEESYPDENWGDGTIISREEDRKNAKALIQDAIEFISETVSTRKRLASKIKYCFKCKPNTKFSKFKAKLIEYKLIKDTSYFEDIMNGNTKNKYINWETHPTYFRYFIVELFKTNLFERGDKKWEIAKNNFTINDLPVPQNIRTYDDEIKNAAAKESIDEAISIFKKQNFSLQQK